MIHGKDLQPGVTSRRRNPAHGPALYARRWWRDDRGSGGSSLTMIMVMPAVLLLIFGGIQFGLHSYARSLALSAAQAGVRAATQAPSSASRGNQAAADFAAEQAGSTLTGAIVTVSQVGDVITVTVTANAPTLVPLTHPTVTGQASARIEPQP